MVTRTHLEMNAAELVESLVAGNRRALARAISLVENDSGAAADVIRGAYAHSKCAPIIGVTGPSGAGKSTLIDKLTSVFRQEDVSIGVLAIDPTSPFTGGALLGDRVRMQGHSEDEGVYVRSMATRGAMGGLAAAVYDTLTLLAAAGLDRLIVETVGVGQDEVDVAVVADTTCVVLTPVGGDEIQAIKAGLMEVADIFVLNKADLPGTDRAEAQLHTWATGAEDAGWSPLIVRTVAAEGEGIDELRAAVAAHEEWYASSGRAEEKRRSLATIRLRTLLRERLLAALRDNGFDAEAERRVVGAIARGDVNPHQAAQEIVDEVFRR